MEKALKKTQTRYRSKFERTTAEALKKKGVAFGYEKHRFAYVKTHYYTPDFLLPNGIYVETKGRFTSADRSKILAILSNHPGIDLRMVFMKDNYLYKGSKTKYTKWCKEHNIKCAVGTIPNSWLKEKRS